MFVIDIFHTGLLAKSGQLQQTVKASVLALCKFAIEQQGEALLEGERLQMRLFELLRESGGHATES